MCNPDNEVDGGGQTACRHVSMSPRPCNKIIRNGEEEDEGKEQTNEISIIANNVQRWVGINFMIISQLIARCSRLLDSGAYASLHVFDSAD